MLKIRLQRRGKRSYATYRLVVAEDGAPIQGRFIADLGHYNPHTDDFKVDKAAALEWISKGVQSSPTVHNLFIDHKIITGKKKTSWRPKKKEAAEEKAAAPAATPTTDKKPAEA